MVVLDELFQFSDGHFLCRLKALVSTKLKFTTESHQSNNHVCAVRTHAVGWVYRLRSLRLAYLLFN